MKIWQRTLTRREKEPEVERKLSSGVRSRVSKFAAPPLRAEAAASTATGDCDIKIGLQKYYYISLILIINADTSYNRIYYNITRVMLLIRPTIFLGNIYIGDGAYYRNP